MPESKNNASIGAFLWAVKDHWITLMSGGIITVLLGVFERFSGRNVPLWVYASVLVFFAFLACYLAWRDARKELAQVTLGNGRFEREFLAERLRTLLRDAEEGLKDDRKMSFMTIGFLPIRNYNAIKGFLEKYYNPETVKRFEAEGVSVVEELLAECYKNGDEILIRNTNNT